MAAPAELKVGPTMNRLILEVASIFAFGHAASAATPQDWTVFASPDQALVAKIDLLKSGEILKIYPARSTAALCILNLKKKSVSVMHGKWSSDSQFFVVSTGFNGGHQPWHWPTFIYSRQHNRFVSFNDLVEDVGTPDFKIVGHHTLEIQSPDVGGAAKPISTNLEDLFSAKLDKK